MRNYILHHLMDDVDSFEDMTKGSMGRPMFDLHNKSPGSQYCKKTAMARINAHKKFDLLWCFGHMSRSDAYQLLASRLNIPKAECHIGQFDISECKEVERVVADYWEEICPKKS